MMLKKGWLAVNPVSRNDHLLVGPVNCRWHPGLTMQVCGCHTQWWCPAAGADVWGSHAAKLRDLHLDLAFPKENAKIYRLWLPSKFTVYVNIAEVSEREHGKFEALFGQITATKNICCQVTTEWCGRQGGKVANLSEVSAKEFQILVPTFG